MSEKYVLAIEKLNVKLQAINADYCQQITDLRKENAQLMQDNSDLKQKVIDLEMKLEKMKGEK